MDVVAKRASRRLDTDCDLGSSELRGEERSTWCFCKCPDCCTDPCWLAVDLFCDVDVSEAEGWEDDGPWGQSGVAGRGEGYSGL